MLSYGFMRVLTDTLLLQLKQVGSQLGRYAFLPVYACADTRHDKIPYGR